MGFIGSVLGTKSGNTGGAGLRYQAGSADLQKAVTQEQVNEAYKNQQDAYKQQQSFLDALRGQGGIQNQSDVYNLYKGLQEGTGPSLAQAQLNQATGQNVANQAALMAGQRGAGANTGLIARQAAQQGANTQQQAVGQLAQLRAQEQLAAMGAMGNIATQQVGQQQGAVQNLNALAQNEQQQLLNSVAAYNNAQVGNMASQNAANAGIAGIAAKGQQDFMGQITGAAGSIGGIPGYGKAAAPAAGGASPAGALMLAAHGGMIEKKYADGGQINSSISSQPDDDSSFLLKYSKGMNQPSPSPSPSASKQFVEGFNKALSENQVPAMAKGGKVPVMLSPGEGYLPPKKVHEVVKGKADPIKDSKKVPGKAKVKGDSEKNDTFKTALDVGGIVLPRTIMNSKNPKKEAYKFIDAVLAKQNPKRVK